MTKRNPLPRSEYLQSLFLYEPDTGILRRRTDRGGRKSGEVVGTDYGEKYYLKVSVNKKSYRIHLIIWKIVTGEEPSGQIDHKDTNKQNNRWNNLREATISQNKANIGLIASNTSGLKGACRYKLGESRGKGWQAGIGVNGKRKHLGFFATKEEAHAAYCKAANEIYGEFARTK
jgi:hypothetical protein